MKKSDIYEVAIKILGLYMITYLVNGKFSVVEVFGNFFRQVFPADPYSSSYNDMVYLDMQNLLATLLLIWLFVFRTKWVARRFCSKSDFQENAKLLTDKKAVYEMSLRISGMLLIGWTFPELSMDIARHNDLGLYLLTPLLHLSFGIILVLGAGIIAHALSGKKLEETEEGTQIL